MNNLYYLILGLELLIYLWAAWTSTLKNDNYFAISNRQIFEKSARNSGRASALLYTLDTGVLNKFTYRKNGSIYSWFWPT
jgi:hypothetical protein